MLCNHILRASLYLAILPMLLWRPYWNCSHWSSDHAFIGEAKGVYLARPYSKWAQRMVSKEPGQGGWREKEKPNLIMKKSWTWYPGRSTKYVWRTAAPWNFYPEWLAEYRQTDKISMRTVIIIIQNSSHYKWNSIQVEDSTVVLTARKISIHNVTRSSWFYYPTLSVVIC